MRGADSIVAVNCDPEAPIFGLPFLHHRRPVQGCPRIAQTHRLKKGGLKNAFPYHQLNADDITYFEGLIPQTGARSKAASRTNTFMMKCRVRRLCPDCT
jgi:hypothetical protein